MRWWNNIMENVKNGVRSWLEIQPADSQKIQIKQVLDFRGNAIKNRIWYIGDSAELAQMYSQIATARLTFWGAKSSAGMEINKLHTGIPGVIVDMISKIVITSLNKFDFSENENNAEIWNKICDENNFKELVEEAVKETLCIGDGAFKITFDRDISDYPILEFYPGDKVNFNRKRNRLMEVEFETTYRHNNKDYVLHEYYGYGYIKYKLTHDGKEVPLNGIPQTNGLQNIAFSGYSEEEGKEQKGSYMLAVPTMFFKSTKWKGRGQSIFDKKIDSFDSLDETWSQWMDALRAGRSKEYIPDSLIPKNPNTGELLTPNAFDNRFIKTNADMQEGAKNEISLKQPAIPHESYAATFITALDLCLQGIISPSTIGIDVKKLDNAEAQREKEKATLYTRDAVVESLTENLKDLVKSSIMAYEELSNPGQERKEVEVDVSFAEYANPSFESQIETIGKGKTQGVMSIEACIEELYGDTKTEEWKKEEVARLKAEHGIVTVEEPNMTLNAGVFTANTEGVQNES